jgi:DNA-binding response OmpR family regulator
MVHCLKKGSILYKILLLEDDTILQEIIDEFLQERGYEVDCFENGQDALDAIEKTKYDMLLLDVNVPEIDGFEIVEYLRDIKNTTPVIFITSLTSVKYLQKAFDIGANDYLKKPFDLDELDIRIKHHLSSLKSKDSIKIGKFTFYPKQNLINNGKEDIALKQKETLILLYFLENKNSIISTDELIENVWQSSSIPSNATIRTYIKNLRKILGNDAITNVKGLGYRLNDI